ncbi:MAG: hypothetical protein IJ995_03775 [Clostridia bacterium]|nr:hypothetical protein [Clostridia bacterium]
MKRKVISLLAILAMLVSMLACFVIPLSAAEETTAYPEPDTQDIALALYKAVVWDDNDAHKALESQAKKAYNGDSNAGIEPDYEKTIELIDGGLADTENPLQWQVFDGEDVPYPRYLVHEAFIARGYTQDKWSISASADWEAMREVADAANVPKTNTTADAIKALAAEKSDYFEGTEFHLTKDIAFANNTPIDPMGFSIYNEGGGFAGTINGHGYGFSYIFIQPGDQKSELYIPDESTADPDDYLTDAKGNPVQYEHSYLHSGLFHRLADCKFIDFGLNSGLVYQTSGNGNSCVSSFGNVKAGAKPEFERVWSSLAIAPLCNAQGTAMVGSFDDQAITVKVNGYVFDGAIVKGQSTSHGGQNSFALYSGGGEFTADGNDFYNIITDYQSCNGKIGSLKATSYKITPDTGSSYTRGGKSALFNFSSVEAFRAADIQNVYAVKREIEGINQGYTLGRSSSWGGSGSDSLLTDMSAAEAAWTINQNPTSLNEDGTGAEPVYFTLNSAGKVRPVSKENYANRIVKLTLTGDRNEEIYVNRYVSYDLSEINKTEQQTFTATENASYFDLTASKFRLRSDVVVEVTDSCEHSFEYAVGDGLNHTKTCETCGYEAVEACALTVDCAADADTADAMTHSGTCVCGAAMTQNCVFEYQKSEGGYQYVCADCARAVDALAPIVAGDVDGTTGVTLVDAIQLLKKVVKDPTITNRNEDADGNNILNVGDVFKTVKIALKDKKTLAAIKVYEDRVNNSNYYYYNKDDEKNDGVIDGVTLTINGEEKYSDNDRYVLTNYIADIEEGNEITFGPVRLGQAVMGYFYKANAPLQLINHTNVTVEHEFERGMVMVSVRVPQGADSVRFQVNADEKEQFYIRINNDFTVADYQCRANLKEATLKNPLKDQLLLTVGDSLCAAANLKRDSQPDGNLKGWARRIYQQFGAKVINSAEGGSAISSIKFKTEGTIETDDEPLSSRQCIVNQLSEHTDIGREFEYILLEGAGNDAANGAAIGSVSPLYDPASFDMTTYAGGLEMMIYTAIKEHGDTAAIGYMSYYDMPGAKYEGMHRNHEYFAVGKQICEKWGIEYLDLNTILNTSESTDIFNAVDLNVHTHDYIHANDDGYDIMQPYINAFLPQMRPVSKAIYDKVQKYADYTVPTFDEYSWDGYVSAEE